MRKFQDLSHFGISDAMDRKKVKSAGKETMKGREKK